MTTKRSPLNLKYTLNIAWLYPELMSTYGDRGNITVLSKRCEWRGIKPTIMRINENTDASFIKSADIIFMGGAQDTQQEIVQKDLSGKKGEAIKILIESGTPGLFICGAYQFLGNYYKDAYGTEIPGLGIFDIHTISIPDKPRLIGNIIVKPFQLSALNSPLARLASGGSQLSNYLTGFENHGGRTYLKDPDLAFGKVIKGSGNNGEDETEGIHYKSTIGTYMHGPVLPQNPEIADYLIENALVKKYGKEIKLNPLDDNFATDAKKNILKRQK